MVKSVFQLVFLCSFLVNASEPLLSASSTSEVEFFEIKSSKIESQSDFKEEKKLHNDRPRVTPTLDQELQSDSKIQVVPTPLRGTWNIGVQGLSGEAVGILYDLDPIVGRVDGVLDLRTLSTDGVSSFSLIQGFESLPYGSQNIAGVLSIETPWRISKTATRISASGGSLGRSQFGFKHQQSLKNSSAFQGTFSHWRSNAVDYKNSSTNDTRMDSYARIQGTALVSNENIFNLKGKAVSGKTAVQFFSEKTEGILGETLAEGSQNRTHATADLKRGTSVLHFGGTKYNQKYRQDLYTENVARVAPQIQEQIGSTEVLAGGQVEYQKTTSTRMRSKVLEQNRWSLYGGARQVFAERLTVGVGARYDDAPKIWSPRAEVQLLSAIQKTTHTTSLEFSRGFREATPKEKFLAFSNPAIGYRVEGNESLKSETAWKLAAKHIVDWDRFRFSTTAFSYWTQNAIAFESLGETSSVVRYSNLNKTETRGIEENISVRLPDSFSTALSYQFLRGIQTNSGSGLFLQPHHRAALNIQRNTEQGFQFLSQLSWTAKQALFDMNRNSAPDSDEFIPSFWMSSIELGYLFKLSSNFKIMRVFARTDNVLNQVRSPGLPAEPRIFSLGAAVDL